MWSTFCCVLVHKFRQFQYRSQPLLEIILIPLKSTSSSLKWSSTYGWYAPGGTSLYKDVQDFLKNFFLYPFPGPHIGTKLIGKGFFLSVMGLAFIIFKKIEKNEIRRVPILACFLVKNPGGKKGGVKRRMLCVISTIFIRWGSNFT